MAMSLPYGLKVLRGDNITILKVSGIDVDCKSLLFTENHTTTYGSVSHSKPIIRPLSDLTKEIEHKGEIFIPVEKLGWGSCFSKSNVEMAIDNLSLHEALKLIEWHFDIAGLTDKNEAIDYHTLEGFSF